jgi:hypothetical protein
MLNRPLTRAALVAAAAAALAIAPASASASAVTTYCVHQPGSSCPAGSFDEGTDLQTALLYAENTPATATSPNVVAIGPGTYSPS